MRCDVAEELCVFSGGRRKWKVEGRKGDVTTEELRSARENEINGTSVGLVALYPERRSYLGRRYV